MLSAAAVLSVFLSGWLFIEKATLSLRSAFAYEQTQLFLELRDRALASDNPSEGAFLLEGVVGYYPSGTKQLTGTALDRLVESHRKDSINAIIRHLRFLTGKDLGNDPGMWVKEICKRTERNSK